MRISDWSSDVCSSDLTSFVLMTLAFCMMRAAPGRPFDRERSLPPQIEAALRSEYQLDAPLWKQYLHYVEALMHGDLGPSFQYEGYRVTELVAAGLPVSLALGAAALALALLLGGAIGVVTGRRPGSALDQIGRAHV